MDTETQKPTITIDGVTYSEDQLSAQAKECINHIQNLDRKIATAQFELTQLQGGREFFMSVLKENLAR
jgi:hypothetical protein